MRRRLRDWLAGVGSAIPTSFSPYWHDLPIGRMKMLLAGTFFIGGAAGFAINLLGLKAPPLGRDFFWPVVLGLTSAIALIVVIKSIRLIPVLYLLALLVSWGIYRASSRSTTLPTVDVMYQRVTFDVIGILVGLGVGNRLLTVFAGTVGTSSVRMQTELALAHGIQATLVPTVSFLNLSFEAYGKSIPSTEMGGDLVDVVPGNGNLLAYVADVSGHGLAAGQLMGMLKAAMRVAVRFEQPPVAMLETADRVLPDLKEPEMFATMALLHFDGSGQVEYASAGHVPILHYRDRSRDIVQLSTECFPLGLIPGGDYASGRVSYSARDLFLMVTDGVTEVANQRDEEFGMTRLEQVLSQYAARPLDQIWDAILSEVKRHGPQLDDQSGLLLRVRDAD